MLGLKSHTENTTDHHLAFEAGYIDNFCNRQFNIPGTNTSSPVDT